MPWRLPYAPLHHHLSPFARCGRHFSTTSARRCKRTSSLLRSTLAHANVRVGQREVKLECKVNVPEWDERAGAPSPLLRFECMRLRQPATLFSGRPTVALSSVSWSTTPLKSRFCYGWLLWSTRHALVAGVEGGAYVRIADGLVRQDTQVTAKSPPREQMGASCTSMDHSATMGLSRKSPMILNTQKKGVQGARRR